MSIALPTNGARADDGKDYPGPYAAYGAKILRGIAKLRGYRGDLPRPTFRRASTWGVEESGAQEEPSDSGRVLHILGLIPEPARPRRAQDAKPRAYFSHAQNEIAFQDFGYSEPSDATLAHELTHALQFELIGELPTSRSLDELLARRALLEGDAMLLATQYTRPKNWRMLLEHRASTRGKPRTHPTYGQVLGRFMYTLGTRFAVSIYDKGGWALLNRAFRRLPVSTEQILHPAKYRAFEKPTQVELPRVATSYDLAHEDSLGELLLRAVFLHHGLGQKRSIAAADGWGGDRVALYRRKPGGKKTRWFLLHSTAWESRYDAARFASATRALLRKEFCTGDPEELDQTFECAGPSGTLSGVWTHGDKAVVFYYVPDNAVGAVRNAVREVLYADRARRER